MGFLEGKGSRISVSGQASVVDDTGSFPTGARGGGGTAERAVGGEGRGR